MYKLVITLTNGREDKNLVFNIHNSNIAARWAKEIQNNYPLYEKNRFQGWPNSYKDLDYYKQELLKQVDIINGYLPRTIYGFENLESQDLFNYLHKFFENLRGEADDGTEFYKAVPLHIKTAIDLFNVLIHECEHYIRSPASPTIVVTFNNRPRFKLLTEDYSLFTPKWKFGEVYINYCEVGKPLLDVFKDKDAHVGEDNIRPQSYYSADFMIKFGTAVPEALYKKKLALFNTWYAQQDYNFENLSLGMIPVASLESGEAYSKFTEVKSVCIK
jgi:hypothetical protein